MNVRDIKRLKDTLIENGESPEEAESLAQVGYFLRRLPVPAADALKSRMLLDVLSSRLPPRKTRLERLHEWYPLAVLLSQLWMVRRKIWPASVMALALGLVVTLLSADTLIFSALAPVVAAVGVALLYDEEAAAMLELEQATRASARLLLLARLTLVFGFDLILALVGSLILAFSHREALVSALVLSWFGPMTFLSALAFFLSITLADTFAATVLSLGLWISHLLLRNARIDVLNLLSMPGLSDPANRPFLLGTSALLMLVALLLAGRDRLGEPHHEA